MNRTKMTALLTAAAMIISICTPTYSIGALAAENSENSSSVEMESEGGADSDEEAALLENDHTAQGGTDDKAGPDAGDIESASDDREEGNDFDSKTSDLENDNTYEEDAYEGNLGEASDNGDVPEKDTEDIEDIDGIDGIEESSEISEEESTIADQEAESSESEADKNTDERMIQETDEDETVVSEEAVVPATQQEDLSTITGIVLDRHEITMTLGCSIRLHVTTTPENAEGYPIEWGVDNEEIAVVDQNGLVTALKPGTTRVYVEAGEKYSYWDECTITVTRKDISAAVVTGIKDKVTYTGEAIQPEVAVKLGSTVLRKGTDYTVKYSANKNVGTASVVIKGTGLFTGTVKKTFAIVKAGNKITNIASSMTLPLSLIDKDSIVMTFNAKDKWNAKKTYKLISVPKKAKKYIKLSSTGTFTVKKGIKAGTYKIKVRVNATGGKNYKKASVTKTIKINVKKSLRSYKKLSSLGARGYSSAVDKKVNTAFDEMILFLAGNGIKYSKLSQYEKAYAIMLYIGSTYYYADGSYNAEGMLDKGYGTCFAYSDLTYCMAKKAGLRNSWLTVPGRNVDHDLQFYGAKHRSVVTKIGKKYYELDSNRAAVVFGMRKYGSNATCEPERISASYAKYLIGKAKKFKSIH